MTMAKGKAFGSTPSFRRAKFPYDLDEMTNDEIRMTNESLMTKPECATASVGLFSLGHLDFVIRHSSFVIRHSSLGIRHSFLESLASEHATAVCRQI
jgi:hypothetical protein